MTATLLTFDGFLDALRKQRPNGVTAAFWNAYLDGQRKALRRQYEAARRECRLPREDTSTVLPLADYDRIIVGFSGGKDSVAALLAVMDERDRQGATTPIELWHHAVDGDPEAGDRFMDWPATPAYCRAVADALGLPLREQWREGGFRGEMTKHNRLSGDVILELYDDRGRRTLKRVPAKGSPNTRRMFPQQSGNMSERWCSGKLKIDVGRQAITNDHRFDPRPAVQAEVDALKASLKQDRAAVMARHPAGSSARKAGLERLAAKYKADVQAARERVHVRLLLITGERREESNNRALYAAVERAAGTTRNRRVDQWRIVIDWPEARVWERMKQAGIVPHPAYAYGYGRVSCAACIFGQAREWATYRLLNPAGFDEIAGYEREFGKTIHRQRSVIEQADRGVSFIPPSQIAAARRDLMQPTFPGPALVDPDDWTLPAGAFRETAGPT